MISRKVAAHVLWHFGAQGGMEPGGFYRSLLDTIRHADPEQRARLGVVYRDYVEAFNAAQGDPDGIRMLQQIAAGGAP